MKTHQNNVLAQWSIEVVSDEKTKHHWGIPWHNCLLQSEKLVLRTNEIKGYRAINQANCIIHTFDFC